MRVGDDGESGLCDGVRCGKIVFIQRYLVYLTEEEVSDNVINQGFLNRLSTLFSQLKWEDGRNYRVCIVRGT